MRATIDDLVTAAEWLDENDGRDGEQEACQRAAAFLRAEVAKRRENAAVLQVSKQTGLKPSKARDVLRRARSQPRENSTV